MGRLFVISLLTLISSTSAFAGKAKSEFQQDLERANKISSAIQKAQCQNLKSFTFMDDYRRFSDNKADTEFAVKVSDKVYEQAFKNCRPESRVPASSMLYDTCKNSCAEFGDSKLRKAISRSSAEVKECQKICMIFADNLSSIASAVQTSYDLFSAKDKSSITPDCNGHVDTSSRSTFKPKSFDDVPAIEHSPSGIGVQK